MLCRIAAQRRKRRCNHGHVSPQVPPKNCRSAANISRKWKFSFVLLFLGANAEAHFCARFHQTKSRLFSAAQKFHDRSKNGRQLYFTPRLAAAQYSRPSIETTRLRQFLRLRQLDSCSPLYFIALHRKTSIETTSSLETTVTR